MTRLHRLLLTLTLASSAVAFQTGRGLQGSRPAGSKVAHSHRRSSRVRLSSGPSLVSTRLQYREGEDETTSTSPLRWLNTIFPSSQRDEDDEQQSVDEYLEFLDRRYRRLHSSEREEGPKPFSALNWLRQGSLSRHEEIISEQQKEDALYVLGVAGLASEKLLHKHHMPVDGDKMSASTTNDFVDADIVSSGPGDILIKRVIVPLIRVVYIVQRRKEMFVDVQMMRFKRFSSKALQRVGKTLIHGPISTAKALLEVGGGKKSLTATFAVLCTLLLVLRPVAQAIVTEGTVAP